MTIIDREEFGEKPYRAMEIDLEREQKSILDEIKQREWDPNYIASLILKKEYQGLPVEEIVYNDGIWKYLCENAKKINPEILEEFEQLGVRLED